MIQNWLHTIQETIGSTAGKEMRYSRSLSVGLCADFTNANYQPKPNGVDRLGKEI